MLDQFMTGNSEPKIILCDDRTGEIINPDDKLFYGCQIRRHKITDELYEEAWSIWKHDVDLARKKKISLRLWESLMEIKVHREEYYLNLFTKYPYLYRDLIRNKKFDHPIYMSPVPGKYFSTGHSRTILSKKFFPDLEYDFVYQSKDYGIGGIDILEKLVNSLPQEKNDLAIIGLARQPGDEIYFLKCVNFISEEYWEDFTYVRPDSFMEQVRNLKMWLYQKKFILDKSLSYEQIFDEIAFLQCDQFD